MRSLRHKLCNKLAKWKGGRVEGEGGRELLVSKEKMADMNTRTPKYCWLRG